MQYGWLDLLGGRWLLLTGDFRTPVRSWMNKKVALAQLQAEGWSINGHHPTRHLTKSLGPKSYGYVMTRTLH